MATCRLSGALCGVLLSCAETAPMFGPEAPPANERPAATPRARAEPSARGQPPPPAFAESTGSPRAAAPDPDRDARALSAACGESDAALIAVARELAVRDQNGETELDVNEMGYALRRAGAPYVWPRAWLFTGRASEVDVAIARMQHWLASFGDGGGRRCGVAVAREASGRIRVGAVAVDVLADLSTLPTRVRVGQWLDVRATLRVPASAAKLVVLGPRGAPHAVPTEFTNGHVRARFNADQPGTWLVQLLAEVEGGPRPVLEALLFAGNEPPSEALVAKAPGEDATRSNADASATLYGLIAAARRSEQLPALARDPRLEELAQAHAEAMRRARKTAHDAGDGDLNQRLARRGIEISAGENVAHAGSAVLAQRALWASPSHRENLLFPAFDSIGVGVAPDSDGTLWICQVFARNGT